jgi:excisionase family DNA binding protein
MRSSTSLLQSEPLLLSPEEAASALGVSRSRIFDLIREGELQSVKLGRTRRVPRAALNDLVDRLSGGWGQ